MPRDVAVIFVHGIHAHDFEYPSAMRQLLLQALPRNLRVHLKSKSVFWADIVRGRSQLYLHQAEVAGGIVNNQYRRLVVEGLGDAAAYQKTRNRDNSAYYQIQDRVSDAIQDAEAREDPARPLVFIGHSLGCHIISSYVWDINRLKQMSDEEIARWADPIAAEFAAELRGASPFRRLGTFAGFVTMGANMPLFTFTFGPDKVYPITRYPDASRRPAFPGTDLSDRMREKALWLNFYSRNDILGYPLKPLNKAYAEEVRLADRHVYAEGYLRAKLLPSALNVVRSHSGYWTNRAVIRDTARLIADLIVCEDSKPAVRS
jgi:hypothetical protein